MRRPLLRVLGALLPLVLASAAAGAAGHVPTEPSREWSTCIAELGCLNTTEDWFHQTFRPHNVLPDKRRTIKTTFLLHRRSGKKEGELFPVSREGVLASGFNASLGVTLLVHDFSSSGFTGWIKRMSGALLAQGERNIVAVDWEEGAQPPYIQAVANARVVALEIVALLRLLVDLLGVQASNVHLIGHGLGAHVAGYVGAVLSGISRITGLDPSGPYFQLQHPAFPSNAIASRHYRTCVCAQETADAAQGMPDTVRLDASDADFVDVIHTDMQPPGSPPTAGRAQGTSDRSGHLDFFPNAGHDQPGCEGQPPSLNLLKVTREDVTPGTVLPGCSHKRAFKYFIESISMPDCHFLSLECANYALFADGRCATCGERGARCSIMGLQAPRFHPAVPSAFYLRTANFTPFCMQPYRVEIALARPPPAKREVEGALTLSLVDRRGEPISMPLASQRLMAHGSAQRLLAFHRPPALESADKAELAWRYHASLLHPAAVCVLCRDSLFVSRLSVAVLPLTPFRPEAERQLCSCDGAKWAEIKSNGSRVFVPCPPGQ